MLETVIYFVYVERVSGMVLDAFACICLQGFSTWFSLVQKIIIKFFSFLLALFQIIVQFLKIINLKL